MSTSEAKNDIPAPNLDSAIQRKVSLRKLISEVERLGKKRWHFIVSWNLGGIIGVLIIYLALNGKWLSDAGDHFLYLFGLLWIVLVGSEIYRQLNVVNKRIDKLVALATLMIDQD